MNIKNNITNHDNCYNCGVCVSVCPKHIISFEQKNGFYKPVIHDQTACIECEKCLNVCAFGHELSTNIPLGFYAGWSKDRRSRYKSSSGGIAFEIAKFFLSKGFHVIGVRYNVQEKRTEYCEFQDVGELSEFRGSKYLQSFSPDAIKKINYDNNYVVFGLPCLIHSFLRLIDARHKRDNFLLVDFFCHGVPSYSMWNKYLEEHERLIGKIKSAGWRDKSNGGWHNSWNMILSGDKGSSHCSLAENDLFYRFFLKNRCLNASCYDSCKYKLDNSAADIRIGDLWAQKYDEDSLGVNGMIAFTVRGKDIIEHLTGCTVVNEKQEIVMEAQMQKCPKRPASFNYTCKALQSSQNLEQIDKKANYLEFFFDKLPAMAKYYPKRVVQKLLGK